MPKKLFPKSQMKISRLAVKQFERRRQNCNLLAMAAPPPLRANAQAEFFLQRWNDFLADPELLRRPERIEIDAFGHFLMSPPPDALHRKQGFRITALLTLSIANKAFASPRSWRPSFPAMVHIPSSPF
jgi:hypothetical protein